MKLDDLLRQHPVTVSNQVNLAAAVQTQITVGKRLRLVRYGLEIITIVVALLVLMKWLQGSLVELLLLPWTRPMHGSWGLYVGALWESAPQGGLLSLAVVGALIAGWRRLETLWLQGRTTTVNKERTMNVVRQLPRLSLAVAAVAVATIGLASYSYAKAADQKKLEILRQQTDARGHQTITTNLSFDDCNSQKIPNLTDKYEVKRGLNLSTGDVAKVIEASCNTATAAAFASQTYPTAKPSTPKDGDVMQGYSPIPVALRVKSYTASSITLEEQRDGRVQTYGPQSLSSQAVIYRDDTKLDLSQLKPGDIVVPVEHYQGILKGERGGFTTVSSRNEFVAFVVLPSSLDFKWYDAILQGGITRISTCAGNAPDECVGMGGMDLYLSTSTQTPAVSTVYKQIQGRITSLNAAKITLASSSGRSFTFTFPSDVVKAYNAQHPSNQIAVGDSLDISYHQLPDQANLAVAPDQIQMASLMIEVTRKEDAPYKY